MLSVFRSFRKHRLYSGINIFGLAIGLAAFFLIGLFVQHEREFDQFHLNKDRIFRVVQEQPGNLYMGTNHFAVTPHGVYLAMLDEMAELESVVQIDDLSSVLSVSNSNFYESGLWATESLFEVFSFELLSGDPRSVLAEPQNIILSESFAKRLFGTGDVIGEAIKVVAGRDTLMQTVSAVMKDVASNSHLDFEYVLPFVANQNWMRQSGWGSSSYYTYGLVKEGITQAQFDEQIAAISHRHLSQQKWNVDDPDRVPHYYSQKLEDIHLKSRVNFDLAIRGDFRYVILFSIVALLILVTASINYMNLATARSAVRAREVGIRKVSGANRGNLVRQFLSEAITTTLISSLLAVGLVIILLPFLGDLVERTIEVNRILNPSSLGMVLLVAIFVGLVSGSYPAFVLSRMQPASILKSSTGTSSRSLLRNVLVISQFSIGIVLVLGTLVIQDQMSFISDTETGVERDHVLSVYVRSPKYRNNPDILLREIELLPGVTGVSSGSDLPIRIGSNSGFSDWEGAPEEAEMHMWNATVNFGYTELAGIELLAGTSFSEDRPSESKNGVLLNETAVAALGWTVETAVGKSVDFNGRTTVTGVMQDFHFQSLHEAIGPLALAQGVNFNSYLLASIDPARINETVRAIEEIWSRIEPLYPFNHEFLDDAFNAQYQTELRLASILKVFTALALIVACLGLFGLAAFTAQQRTREIGIRKVLGATSPSIMMLMSKDFGVLVLVSFLIGAPMAFIGMTRWLDDFAYRTEIGVETFLAVGLVAMFLALITVGYQAVRASFANPVESLRHE